MFVPSAFALTRGQVQDYIHKTVIIYLGDSIGYNCYVPIVARIINIYIEPRNYNTMITVEDRDGWIMVIDINNIEKIADYN
jgi:hypothetical protein